MNGVCFRFRFLLLWAAVMTLPGCYYMTQGRYLLSYQQKARPAAKLLKNPRLPRETREFLLLVEDIRQFGVETLGLKENKNYTSCLSLEEDVLAWVVSASDSLAFDTHLWKYPFLGKLPYKGYYRMEDAQKEALRLKTKGLDVWVRGVEAFSTLGIFKDPLISYMAEYPVHRIASLVFHEQTHATIWRKRDTGFNEELAEFVGDEGSRLFVLDRYGPDSPEYRRIESEKQDSRRFKEDIFRLRDRLNTFYQSLPQDRPNTEAYYKEKEKIIRTFQDEFLVDYEKNYLSDNYRRFTELSVNNAYLELFQLYSGNRSWFEEKYAAAGFDMKVFIASLR